jgi:hypothetical protein
LNPKDIQSILEGLRKFAEKHSYDLKLNDALLAQLMAEPEIDVKNIVSFMKSLVEHRYNCNPKFSEWICSQSVMHLSRGI